jgi:pyruvate dehydrogenase E2 component (dihydrolipoamide acetyltransferase)
VAFDIVMPNLGFDAQTGRLIEWVKEPGDPVQKGDILAIVESDKANVELESVAAGVMLEQLVGADTEVAVGAVIARVGSADEAQPGATTMPAPQASAQTGSAVQNGTLSTRGSTSVEVSPVARRMAQEHQIELSRVTGSGPGGRITRSDVEALVAVQAKRMNGEVLALPKLRKLAREQGIDLTQVRATGTKGQITARDLAVYQEQLSAVAQTAEQVPAAAVESAANGNTDAVAGRREISVSRARRVIGERLGKSKREAPHFYVSGEFDLQSALARLAAMPAPQPRINDLIQYLTVQTLLLVPELNATYEAEHVYQYNYVYLGIAVALNDGLITPVLRNAENYSLLGLAKESRALITRTREGHLRADDLQSATFTISNMGMIQQVERFTAVINPPQVGILAVGSVKPRAVVIADGLSIRQTVYLTLSGDHRVVDGMHLGRFMAVFGEQLDSFVQGG